MRIRFSIGGRKGSNRPKTERNYYVTAIWCFITVLLYLFKAIDSESFRFDSSSSLVFLPFLIIFTTTAILNLIKGIKLTRKRLANKRANQNESEDGYVYCTQCGCRLLEGIQVCPYCDEPIHTEEPYEEPYEEVRTASFEDASPEVKEKPSILVILSVVALIAGAVILLLYNVGNPYKHMDTTQIYSEAEAIMADFSLDKIGDMGKLIAELESRDDCDVESIRSSYNYLLDKIFEIGESATYGNGYQLRQHITEILAFDLGKDSWNVKKLIDYLSDEYKLYIIFGHKWKSEDNYFYLHYKDETKTTETLSVALPNDKEADVKYTFDYKIDEERGVILFWYESEFDQIIDAYQIWDVYYSFINGWSVEIYIESTDETVILYG